MHIVNHDSHRNTIQFKKKNYIRLNLNCKSFGIYVAILIKCAENYMAQTKNSFSIRCNDHKANWKKFDQNLVLRIYMINLLCLNIIT